MTLTSFREEADARQGDVVDYTRFRLSKRIQVCEKCGRRGRLGTATTRAGKITIITHKKENKGWCWVGPSPMDGLCTDEPDHCMVRKQKESP